MDVKIKYHDKELEKLCNIEGGKSDWIDLRSAHDLTLKKGDFSLISLGVSIEISHLQNSFILTNILSELLSIVLLYYTLQYAGHFFTKKFYNSCSL